MTRPAVHQFLPLLTVRDAIGTHTLELQALLRNLDFDSEIFAIETDHRMAGLALPYAEYLNHRAHSAVVPTLIYQCSIDSPMVNRLLHGDERTIVNYHNITPGHLIARWSPRVAQEVTAGRRQVGALAAVGSAAIADSTFNAAELTELGYPHTRVSPPLFDLSALTSDPDPATMQKLSLAKAEGGADLLFVGRLSPHKAQHDLVKALAAYRGVFDPHARLHLVGGCSFPSYHRALEDLARSLGLRGAVNIAGSVDDAELAAYYRTADVFVSASDHEGFCIPLVEAMHYRVPVVAFAAGAVPETAAGGALLLAHKTPAHLATGVDRVLRDPSLRTDLRARATEAIERYQPDRLRKRFTRTLQQVLPT